MKPRWSVFNFLVKIVLICGIEGIPVDAAQHLLRQDTQGPVVNTEAIIGSVENFYGVLLVYWLDNIESRITTRSNVMRSAAECAGQLPVDVLFAHPEICKLDVARPSQHHVVELKIPVHNPHAVEEQEGQANLGGIETHLFFRKSAFLQSRV